MQAEVNRALMSPALWQGSKVNVSDAGYEGPSA
jgi:hypothetical protein